MARKSRMGRNLDALLHGVAKERRELPAERHPSDAPADAVRPDGHPDRTRVGTDDARPAPLTDSARSLVGESDDTASGRRNEVRADLAVVRARPVEARAEAHEAATDDAASGTIARGDGNTARDEGGDTRVGEGRQAPSPGMPTAASDVPTPAARTPIDEASPDEDLTDDAPTVAGDPPRPGDRLRMIGVERIRRGVFQPRRFFDQEALQELADSLKAQGMIQPIIVRPIGNAFELIAGERRWRAAQIAGLAEIPAIVREMEDRSVAAVSLIENIQREDLNPLEEAQALTRLCDEFGMTHASVAESIGRSRASVSNLMRLLELHDEVKTMVDKGELDMGHARALLRVPKVDQPALAARVAKQGLTVRAVEKLIRTGVDKAANAKPESAPDPDIERLIERLSGVLGASVSIRHKPGGAGRLEIRYGSLEELDGILAHIK